MQIDRFVSQFVILEDSTTTNLKSLSVSHSLILSESLHQNLMPVDGANNLHLHDIAHVVKTQNLVASNAITFSMDAQPRVSMLDVEHSLLLWHLLKREVGPSTNALVLSQSVTVVPSKATNSSLVLTDVATVTVVRNRSVLQTVGLSHYVNVYKPARDWVPFPIVIPAPTDVRFYLAGVVDETFRAPLFGNTDELSFQRVNRRSRGGDLIIYRDNEWPATETLRLQFDFPCQSDADRLLNVIRQTIGRYIEYTDHEDTVWTGVITNPDTTRVQSGRHTFNVEVVIEVELAP